MIRTLRQQLGIRYALVLGFCLLLLGGIAYHEFVREPRALHVKKVPVQRHQGEEDDEEEGKQGSGEASAEEQEEEHEDTFVAKYMEVLLYASLPVALVFGWYVLRRSLQPLDDLASGVEAFDASNLGARLPRSHNGDQVDRLSGSFNAMAERLDASFQQIREFTLHASHELKTPLTIMRSELETVLADPGIAPAHREQNLNLLDELFRLVKIVDGLTLLAKADAGILNLELQPLALQEIVRECYEDALILAEPHHVVIDLRECQEITVQGDRHRLRQLLLGLTDNALKYNHPGGTVTISLCEREAAAEITVANTGPGIPPHMQEKIFERFVRGKGAQQANTEGCGLGLSIARWIVQAHHGTIHINSVPDGLTTVVVSLPAVPEDGGIRG